MGTGAISVAYGLAIRTTMNDVTAPVILGICLFSLGLFALRFSPGFSPDGGFTARDDLPEEYIRPPRTPGTQNRF